MPYKCPKCGNVSANSVKCDACKSVYLTPPQQVEETEPQPTKTAEPITRKRGVAVVKTPPSVKPNVTPSVTPNVTPNVTPSVTPNVTPTVKTPPSTGPKKDIVNDPPTQQEFRRVVVRHPRARVNIGENKPPVNLPPVRTPPSTPPTTTGTPPLRQGESKWTKTAPRPSEMKPTQPIETTRDKATGDEESIKRAIIAARKLADELKTLITAEQLEVITKTIVNQGRARSLEGLNALIVKLEQIKAKALQKQREETERKQKELQEQRLREEELRKQEEQRQFEEEQRRLEEEQRRLEEEQRRIDEEQRRLEEEQRRLEEERRLQEAIRLKQEQEEREKRAAQKRIQETVQKQKEQFGVALQLLNDPGIPWPKLEKGDFITRLMDVKSVDKYPELVRIISELKLRAQELKNTKRVVPSNPPPTGTKPVPPRSQVPPPTQSTTSPPTTTTTTTDTRTFEQKVGSLTVKGKETLNTLKTSRGNLATAVVNALASFPPGEESLMRQQQLMDVVRFGPISKGVDASTELGRKREQAKAKIVESFKQYPDLALGALDLINQSNNPETIAAAVAELGPIIESGFGIGATPQESQKMAINALRTGSVVGGDFAARLKEYYASDKPTRPDALRGTGPTETTLNYSGSLGTSLLKPDGRVDFNQPGAKALVDNLQFHPESLKKPMLNFVKQIESFKQQFASDPKCAQALTQVREPIGTGAPQDVIRKTLKLHPVKRSRRIM